MKKLVVLFSVWMVFAMLLGACQPQIVEKTVEVEKVVEKQVEVEKTVVVEVEKKAAGADIKMAAIFPGVVTDADYNTLAFVGLNAVKSNLGAEIAYSESVPVPDVDRAMREYIDAGYNVVWTHGGQFVNQTVELAKQFPDVVFIAEGDAAVENPPANLWFIDRNFHIGYYAIGVLAAKASKSGKIGYIGGLTLPFSYAEVHAIEQAIAEQGLTVEFKPVWAGDFNDPTKARQVADAMIADGADVIMGSLNLGMFGLFEAVKAVPDKGILVTAKYTDKTSFAPTNYVTSLLYDFEKPMMDITQKIIAGEKGGYYPLGFDTGVAVQMPLKNVDEALNAEIEALVADIISGKIEVKKDNTPIE
ncbi:MAG: BMP family protein [Anaerolineae bacterium]|nr:BMP family protein [Anaerolineae bacterium]